MACDLDLILFETTSSIICDTGSWTAVMGVPQMNLHTPESTIQVCTEYTQAPSDDCPCRSDDDLREVGSQFAVSEHIVLEREILLESELYSKS